MTTALAELRALVTDPALASVGVWLSWGCTTWPLARLHPGGGGAVWAVAGTTIRGAMSTGDLAAWLGVLRPGVALTTVDGDPLACARVVDAVELGWSLPSVRPRPRWAVVPHGRAVLLEPGS